MVGNTATSIAHGFLRAGAVSPASAVRSAGSAYVGVILLVDARGGSRPFIAPAGITPSIATLIATPLAASRLTDAIAPSLIAADVDACGSRSAGFATGITASIDSFVASAVAAAVAAAVVAAVAAAVAAAVTASWLPTAVAALGLTTPR